MAERKWTSPRLFLSLHGDKVAAKRLERKARVLVGYLFDQLRGGQTYRTQTWRREDGSVIQAFVWRDILGEKAVVRISVDRQSVSASAYIFVFENGAIKLVDGMAEAPPPVGQDPLPLDVYFGSQLYGYFASGGTTAKVSNELFHLQGSASFGETDFLADTATMPSASPYSSEIYKRNNGSRINQLLQQLDDERFYQLSPLTPSITLSSQYTGVMRLAVQAWMGVGRSPGPGAYVSIYLDLIVSPASNYPCPHNNPNPFTDGLIFDDAYNFWWVRIGSGTITFTKLKPTQAIFAQEILAAGGLTAEQERKYLLALMSWLVPDTEVAEVVVDIAGLDNVTGGGRAAVAHGWHFNHSSPWKAAIVTQREGAGSTPANWYREATQAELTFSFDINGVPDATLSILEQDQLFALPVIHTLWYPSAVGAFCPLGMPLGVTRADQTDVDVPLYCYYNQNNSLCTLRWEFDHTVSVSVYNPSEIWPCGSDQELLFEGYTAHSVHSGGFYTTDGAVNQTASATPTSSVSRTYDKRKTEFNTTVVNTTTTTTAILNLCGGAWPSTYDQLVGGLGTPPTDIRYLAGTIEYQRSICSSSKWANTWNYSAYCQFGIIPTNDAEGIFVGADVEVYISPYDTEDFTYSGTYITGANVSGMQYKNASTNNVWTESGLSYNTVRRPSNFGTQETSSSVRFNGVRYHSGVVQFCSSRGTFPAGTAYPGYAACYGYALDAPCEGGCGGNASLGYNAAGWYKDVDQDNDRTVLDAYPSDMTTDVRWIGDA